MFGAIAGDVIGSTFEWHNIKTTEFELFSKDSRFTDDTVTTIAIADAILNSDSQNKDIFQNIFDSSRIYAIKLKEYSKKYPGVGYGSMFEKWVKSNSFSAYNSFGNGSAMRVSPIGFVFDTLEKTIKESKKSACATHNHKKGIKGAQAVAASIYLARIGESKKFIKSFIKKKYAYNLSSKLDDIRENYKFDSTCEGSVPQSIIAFLESENFEDSIRKAISIGGDSDTIACITGGIAQAYYKKIPEYIVNNVNSKLNITFKNLIDNFNEKFNITY